MANTKAFIAAGLALVAVIFVFLGLFTNGWATGEEGGFEAGIGLREMETSGGGMSMDFSLSELADLEETANEAGKDIEGYEESTYNQDLNMAGLIAYIVLWIAAITCIGALVFAILGGIGKSGKLGVQLGFAGGALMLLAAIIWVILKPKLEDPMGIGWTFYIIIVGGVLQCVGGGLMIGCKKAGGEAAPEPAAAPEQPPW